MQLFKVWFHNFFQLHFDKLHPKICGNYVRNILGAFQETIVQGICRRKSQQRTRRVIFAFARTLSSPRVTTRFWTWDPIEEIVHGNLSRNVVMCYWSADTSFSSPEPMILLACGRNRELWEQPFQAYAIDADCVKPDGQNSAISFSSSFVISKWLLPELPFSDRWSRGTKSLGTSLRIPCFDSSQLTKTWISNIKDVPMAMVPLSYFAM